MDGLNQLFKLHKPGAISWSTAVGGVLTVTEDFTAHSTGILSLYLVTWRMWTHDRWHQPKPKHKPLKHLTGIWVQCKMSQIIWHFIKFSCEKRNAAQVKWQQNKWIWQHDMSMTLLRHTHTHTQNFRMWVCGSVCVGCSCTIYGCCVVFRIWWL